jgi:hypothetical protein
MGQPASRYGGWMSIYRISSREQLTRGVPQLRGQVVGLQLSTVKKTHNEMSHSASDALFRITYDLLKFSDAVSSSFTINLINPNDRMNKELERIGGRGLIQGRLLYQHLAKEPEENYKIYQSGQPASRDLNQGPAEYEAGVLSTRSRSSVLSR